MKIITLATALLVLTAGMATAQPGYKHGNARYVAKHGSVGKLTLYERFKIRRSRARLVALRHRARADGRVTRRERIRIRIASKRHRALVRRERRD